MLFPYNTDAPIYYWPWATLALIVANLGVFAATGAGMAPLTDDLSLIYDDGLHPVQWLSSNFVHYGFMHLFGNMIALWGFGLVVEGKIGWWRFLVVYLGIGVVGGAIEQALSQVVPTDAPGSGGASLVIYGLIAISLVWAPQNEMNCVVILFYRIFHWDISILFFSLIYIGLQILFMAIGGFAFSSEALHLLGAALGFAVGAFMLKAGLVDCEGWDLWSVMVGRHTSSDLDAMRYGRAETDRKSSKRERSRQESEPQPAAKNTSDEGTSRPDGTGRFVRQIRQAVDAGQTAVALDNYQRLKHLAPDAQLDPPLLLALTNALCKEKNWSAAVPLLQECIERVPNESSRLRVKLAAIVLEVQGRPQYALRLIEPVNPADLGATDQDRLEKIRRKATKQVDEGVLELDGQAWN